jgi:hypothetical protein
MKQPYLRSMSAALGLAVCLLGGCAQVRPWEKGILSRPDMTFESDVLETKFAEHIYSSKESSSGGAGVGGGGCGCN